MRPRLLCVGLLCALFSSGDGAATTGEFSATAGPPLHADDGHVSTPRGRDGQEPIQEQQVWEPAPGPAFSLRVQVNDVLSRQLLSRAVVEVYSNYSRSGAALTGRDGGAVLHVPYRAGLPITVVASKDGYMSALLPCATNRMPIFSSVTMSLHGLHQGNVWLYEDSVLITGRTSDVSSLPAVRFPRSLLNLTHGANVTSIVALLTVPKLASERDGSVKTVGIMTSKSGYVSVQLSPVAAVSVHLYSEGTEVDVRGPIQISLSVPDGCGMQAAHVVPAWFFNRTTGGWMRKGLGTVVSVDGKLAWAFTAPHLGYWIAASVSPPTGFFGLAAPADFLLRHSLPLAALFGGLLVTAVCLLAVLIHYCRSTPSYNKAKRMLPALRKDQTTSTCDEKVFEVSTGGASHPLDGTGLCFAEKELNRRNGNPMASDDVIANRGAVAIALECSELELSDLARAARNPEQVRLAASPTDNLFFYNQPVAILHAPAFFHLDEQPELAQWSRSATLPRAGAPPPEQPGQDGFTQTQPKTPSGGDAETEEQPGASGGNQEAADTAAATPRGPFNMSESASVPGTLSKLGHGRRSAHNLGGLRRSLSPQPPRAWFVSLEGKPAAEIHYAVSEQQRRRRPVESRETSLDSGVDMSELSQASGRRTVTLERNATFVKSSASSKHVPPQ